MYQAHSYASYSPPAGQLHAYSQPGDYGGTYYAGGPYATKPANQLRRVNLVPVAICLLVPWVLYCSMSALLAFNVHYASALLCYCIALVVLLVIGFLLRMVHKTMKAQRADTSWTFFLCVTCFLAWAVGFLVGDVIYFQHMEPYYSVGHLNDYGALDPSSTPGQQVMDAGRVSFARGTKLDLSKPMAFRNVESYCVVPITNAKGKAGPSGSYDFWAVGLNCCPQNGMSFQCGEYNNPQASAGLRLMRDDQDGYYRLAVKQAESEYKITAKHPLFFHWMQDPVSEVDAMYDTGMQEFIFGTFAYFAFQLFLIVVFVILFPRNLG